MRPKCFVLFFFILASGTFLASSLCLWADDAPQQGSYSKTKLKQLQERRKKAAEEAAKLAKATDEAEVTKKQDRADAKPSSVPPVSSAKTNSPAPETQPSAATDGPKKEFYDTGELKSEAAYIDGKMEGRAVWYFKNGKKAIEADYHHGAVEGASRIYYPDGKLKLEGMEKGGVSDGLQKAYYPNGNPSREIVFDKGRLSGPFKTYYESGKLECQGIFDNGQLKPLYTCNDAKGSKVFYTSPDDVLKKIKDKLPK